MARMSDRPMSKVSSAALAGTQACWCRRSTGSPCVHRELPPLAAGRSAPFAYSASSLSLISAALLSGPRSRCVTVVIASPRVLLSRYLPSLGNGPVRRDGLRTAHRGRHLEGHRRPGGIGWVLGGKHGGTPPGVPSGRGSPFRR